MDNPKAESNAINLTYAQSGVDINAGNEMVEKIKPIIASTRRPGANTEIGGFGGLFDLKAIGYNDPILVAANDGVGTKLKIAIETQKHDTIGIDLVAMCVNDLIVQGAQPLFFLDYFACEKLDPDQAAIIISGIAEGCRQAGASLIGGETAEMPGLYARNDYDLAGFAVGAVERHKLLPSKTITAGDLIFGLCSSGIHANGFSLIRKIITDNNLDLTKSAPFSPSQSLAEILLIPTKIYVNSVLHVLETTGMIKALAHITGGGFWENIPRILPQDLIAELDLNAIPVPAIFSWLAKIGHIDPQELLRVFNCGIGMIYIVSPQDAHCVEDSFKQKGESPILLGKLVPKLPMTQEKVRYQGTLAL